MQLIYLTEQEATELYQFLKETQDTLGHQEDIFINLDEDGQYAGVS